MKEKEVTTFNELEFAIFCIENVAAELGVNGEDVYNAFTRKSNLLNDYIVPCYDALHTQGKSYIVADILRVMKDEGIRI